MNHKEALQYIKEETPSLFASEQNGAHLANHPSLEQLFNEWVDPTEKILAINVSMRRGNVIIVTEMTNKTKTQFLYSVIRMFPTTDKWHVSMDKDHKSLPEVIDYLLY